MTLLGVLGPTVLVGPDGPIRLGSTRQRRLLTALALHAGTSVSAGELAELIWDATDAPADPTGALQTNVARLRRLLPEGVIVETTTGGYRLRIEGPAELDTAAFGALLDEASSCTSARRLDLLARATELWRGRPFCELDHPSVDAEVTRLDELRSGAEYAHAETLLEVGRLHEAIASLEAQTRSEPLREAPVALLMRALVTAGRQGDALAAYSRLRAGLAAELGLDPSAQLQELEQQVLRQELPQPVWDPPPRAPLSSFVGRDGDVEQVGGLLGTCRIVTLCGPGGVGKSRLATHAAIAVASRYPDGVLTVELADGGPSDVEPALAGALRLADSTESTLRARIVDVLAVRRSLLVLDNCEHVADEVAVLVEAVTAGAPGVDLLLTSREPLRVDGEHVLPVTPLPEDLAATLLADRIRAVDPTAEPDGHLLLEVSRRLDGLPLALELAAARVPALGVRGLLDGLAEPLEVLSRGRRTAAPRHRSLGEVVEWSFGLLDGEQRDLFVRLAVFAGSVEPAAVEAVCGSARALPDLVDRSLVGRSRTEPAMFGLLETIRAFGRSRLATDPATPGLRTRHAAWAVSLAEEVWAGHESPDEAHRIRRFNLHLADLRRAHAWMCHNGPLEDLLRLGLVLADQAFEQARIDLVRLVDETLAAAGLPGPDSPTSGAAVHPLLARLLGLAAASSWQRGDLPTAEARCTQAFAVAGAAGDPAAAREAWEALGNVASFRGDLSQALVHCGRSLELSRSAGDRGTELIASVDLVIMSAYAGDHDAAEHYERACSELAEQMSSPTALAWAAYAAGERRAELGSADATPYLERAVELATTVDADFVVGIARHTLLTTAARRGDPAEMMSRVAPVLDHWYRAGAWTQLWIALRALVEALSRAGRHREVALLLGAREASTRAPREFGPDSARHRAARDAARDALGADFEKLLAEGATLGDAGAVAYAREISRDQVMPPRRTP